MSDEKLRLGGMALRNGLALFGPTSWAAAVRTADGDIRVASGPRPRFRAADRVPLARGVVRMSEMLAALPVIRRRLPEARLSFEHGSVATAAVVCAALATVVRRRGGFRGELALDADRHRAVARHAAQPRPRALPRRRAQDRGRLRARRRGGRRRPRSTSAAARTSSRRSCSAPPVPRASPRARRAGCAAPSARSARWRPIGFAFELFAWRERHPGSLGARALARPGHGAAARARDGRAGRGGARGGRARARRAARGGGAGSAA